MNKIFCVSCGFKNVYEVTKPKFCASCGSSVDGVVKTASRVSRVDQEDEDVSIDIASIDLEKLKKGISAELPNQKLKIEDVIGTADPNEKKFTRKPSSLPDGKAIFQQNIKDVAPATRFKDIDE